MSDSIESLPGYSEARAQYDGALTAAKAEGNEVAELRAQLAWRDAQDGFRTQLADRQAKQNAIAQAKADAKSKFAHAPEAVYAHLEDPAAIAAAAEAAHNAISAAIPGQAPQPQRPQTQPWPAPPAGGPPQTPQKHEFDDADAWQQALQTFRATPKAPGSGMNDPNYKKMFNFVVGKVVE